MAISKVLVPIDGSPTSYRGLMCATSLAKKLGAEITLLHVVESPSYAFAPRGGSAIPPEAFARIEESADKLLQRRALELAEEGVKSQTLLKRGSPAKEILKASSGYDLIVMGRQGLSRLQRLMVGSVSNRVLEGSKIPVMIVEPE